MGVLGALLFKWVCVCVCVCASVGCGFVNSPRKHFSSCQIKLPMQTPHSWVCGVSISDSVLLLRREETATVEGQRRDWHRGSHAFLLQNWQISLLRRCLLLWRGAFPRLLFSPRNREDRSTVPVAAAPLTSPAMLTIANTCTTCTQMCESRSETYVPEKKPCRMWWV